MEGCNRNKSSLKSHHKSTNSRSTYFSSSGYSVISYLSFSAFPRKPTAQKVDSAGIHPLSSLITSCRYFFLHHNIAAMRYTHHTFVSNFRRWTLVLLFLKPYIWHVNIPSLWSYQLSVMGIFKDELSKVEIKSF